MCFVFYFIRASVAKMEEFWIAPDNLARWRRHAIHVVSTSKLRGIGLDLSCANEMVYSEIKARFMEAIQELNRFGYDPKIATICANVLSASAVDLVDGIYLSSRWKNLAWLARDLERSLPARRR